MKKQYKWITVLFSLIFILSVCISVIAGVYSKDYYQVFDCFDMLVDQSLDETITDNVTNNFAEPVENTYNLLLTTFLGKQLEQIMPRFYELTLMDDFDNSVDELLILYEESAKRLDELSVYNWSYFVDYYTAAMRDTDPFTNSNIKNFTTFFEDTNYSGNLLSFNMQNNYQELYSYAYSNGYLYRGVGTSYNITTAYKDHIKTITSMIDILEGAQEASSTLTKKSEINQILGVLHNVKESILSPENHRIAFALNDMKMPEFYNAQLEFSSYYIDMQNLYERFYIFLFAMALALGSAVILIMNLTGFLRKLFKFSSKILMRIPIEIKILVWSILMLVCALYSRSFFIRFFNYSSRIIYMLIILELLAVAGFLFNGAMIFDIYYNKLVLAQKSICWKIRKFCISFSYSLPFIKRQYIRTGIFSFFCGLAFLLTFLGYLQGRRQYYLIGIIVAASATYYYCNKMRILSRDLDIAAKKIADINSGNFNNQIDVEADSDMKQVIGQLVNLQDTIENEVQERIKSEKLKVELITNVSHDLKTPLTSIINYIKLLENENLTPKEANDYVKVLKNKAGRLKGITEDLFDLAKVNSGEMAFVIEVLELNGLIEQTLAENQQIIEESKLQFRVNTQKKVYISADGQKIYRIFDNIIGNAIKYSMFGTRVYIDIEENCGIATVTVKNISNYEMDFNPEEIADRFVRGEEARSSEGSGLGLSIVSSFAESMGGSFHAKIDGDLFKAIIRFPSVKK